jgi:subtilisin family serine protease
MRIVHALLASAVGGMISSAPVLAQATAESDVALGTINNQFICTLDSSVPRENVRAEAARAAGRVLGEILHTYEHTIKGFAVRAAAQPGKNAVAEMRRANPRIESCEQDQVMKAFVVQKGDVSASADTIPWGIARVGGAGSISQRTAWVIDTGIDLDHPDLEVDAGRSVSYVKGTGGADDQNGHGTHVAGTIAAKANGSGVVGVSPGTTVVAVRVLDRRGSGTTSGVIKGVDYVAANGQSGDVANMSLGGGASTTLDNAVIAAAANGIHFTLAAGNEGVHANTRSPARAGGREPNDTVYTVSAFSQTADRFASFSNHGNPPIEWSEPGVSIYSTYKNGGYATLSGTSMAAPHLAGILVQGGVSQCGSVTGDRDSSPDKIGSRTAC